MSGAKRGVFSRMMRWLPVRPRAALSLLMLALIAWVPMLIALLDAMRATLCSLDEEYGRWAGTARVVIKALWTGENQ